MIGAGRSAWRYVRCIAEAYGADSGPLLAAAISFYALLSLVPLLSLGVAVLGWVLGSNQSALTRIHDTLLSILPTSGDLIYSTLRDIRRDTGITGLIGIGGLLLAASAIFGNLEVALNTMWRVRKMRSWWRQRLMALGTALLILALLFLSIGITSVFTWMENQQVPGLEIRAGGIPVIWQVAGHLVPLILSIMMFTLIYKIVPNCPVRWRSAIAGGVFAGAAWEGAKYLFALYVAHFANYNKVYGSLGAIVSLMFYAYYSASIMFIGGEIAARHTADAQRPDRGETPAIPHPQPREDAPEASSC